MPYDCLSVKNIAQASCDILAYRKTAMINMFVDIIVILNKCVFFPFCSIIVCCKGGSQPEANAVWGAKARKSLGASAINITTFQRVQKGTEKTPPHLGVTIATAPSAARGRLLLFLKVWWTHAAMFRWQTRARITSRVPVPAGQAVLQYRPRGAVVKLLTAQQQQTRNLWLSLCYNTPIHFTTRLCKSESAAPKLHIGFVHA